MTRSRRTHPRRAYRRNADRQIRITDDRRDPPDRVRLARALLQHARDLAAAQAEADAIAERTAAPEPSPTDRRGPDSEEAK
jgi:hypothetical protein